MASLHRSSRYCIVLALVLASAGQFAGHAAAEDSQSKRWEKDIAAYEAADKTNPPPQNAILFIGSSGIRRWTTLQADFPEYKVINRGFGGSHIADSVHYADRIVIPYKPRLIVFRAGINDLHSGKSPERVLKDFSEFVAKVRAALPDVRIAFMSINPSLKYWDHIDAERKANQLIKDYILAGDNLEFIDVNDAMLGPDGKPRPEIYVKDGLHLTPEGYRLWTSLVKPHLGKTDNP